MHIYSFFEKNKVLWFGTPFGLYQYNKKEIKNTVYRNKALIRQVFIGKDSLLFGGTLPNNADNSHKNNASDKPFAKIKYDLNVLNFVFSNPYYNNEDKILYQYKLNGFDESWSNWSLDDFKSYTNLFEGKYLFLVRAKNVYGQVSEIGSFSFRISPPWYRTILAYIIYIIVFIISIYLFVRI